MRWWSDVAAMTAIEALAVHSTHRVVITRLRRVIHDTFGGGARQRFRSGAAWMAACAAMTV
jgi:hypothetical protein